MKFYSRLTPAARRLSAQIFRTTMVRLFISRLFRSAQSELFVQGFALKAHFEHVEADAFGEFAAGEDAADAVAAIIERW